MFDQLVSEITEEMWPFRTQIAEREQVRAALALSEQKRIAVANGAIERKFMEGIGEVVASFSADVYHRLGHMYGYETVNSPDFLRTMLRDNPELRVKSRTTKVGIVVPCDWKENIERDVEQTLATIPLPDTTAQPLEAEDADCFANVIAFPDAPPAPLKQTRVSA